MATNIPPHNLTEVIDGCLAYLNDSTLSVTQLLEFIQAPDFPTGALINGFRGRTTGLWDRPWSRDYALKVPYRRRRQEIDLSSLRFPHQVANKARVT